MISIVVPIYNSERFLRECLNSIQNQSFADFEVIMIDDGSTDGSSEICKSFETTDCRFHYYYKENGGAGSARNYGISISRGEYIAFVDSDDTIEKDYLEVLHALTADNSPTIVQCGITLVRNGKNTVLAPKPGYYDGKGFAELILKREIHIFLLITTTSKLYNRAFIMEHRLRFDEQVVISEDCLFNTQYLLSLESIAFTDYAGYYYMQDHSFLTRKKKTYQSVEQSIKVGYLTAEIRNKTIQKYDLSNDSKVRWGFHTAICKILISNADEIENNGFSGKERKKLFDLYFPRMNYPVDAAIDDVHGVNHRIVELSVKKRRRSIELIYMLRRIKAKLRGFVRRFF